MHTMVLENPGSNLTTSSCFCHGNHCAIQPWAWAVHPYCSV